MRRVLEKGAESAGSDDNIRERVFQNEPFGMVMHITYKRVFCKASPKITACQSRKDPRIPKSLSVRGAEGPADAPNSASK